MIHTLLEGLIRRSHHLKALLVAILDCLHLDTQVFNRLVQVLDHRSKLIVLLHKLIDLIGVKRALS